jgi:iron complex outermembrane receptor protein
MIGKSLVFKWSSIALIAAAGLTAPVLTWSQAAAKPAAKASAGAGIEEIVVTARKTEESLQTTPVAVTALSDVAMTERQVDQVLDLGRTAPDLAVTSSGPGGAAVSYVSIRGEAKQEANSVSDSSVATYVDGVYYARPVVGNLGFLDVNSIEVLRGPQGTLFGRNTTGGALNVTTKQPSGKFEGNLLAGFGNFGSLRAEGAVNIPLMGDELAMRVAARVGSHDAYFDNKINGVGPGELKHDASGRVTVRWAPSGRPFTLSVSGDVTDERDTGVAIKLAGFNPAPLDFIGTLFGLTGVPPVPSLTQLIVPATGYNPTDFLVSNTRYRNTYGNPNTLDPEMNKPNGNVHATGVSATLDWDIGAVHLKSISAYRSSDSGNSEDLDGTPINILAFVSQYKQHQGSEELQLSGKINKWDLIGGLYYFKEGGTERSASESLGFISSVFDLLLGFPNGTIPTSIDQDFGIYGAESKAVFAQANYHISDTVRATLGYRYTWDDRDLTRYGRSDIFGVAAPPATPNACAVGLPAAQGGTFGNPAGLPCSEAHSASYTYPAYVFGLDWQVRDDLFLYFKTSKASMAGGFNTRPVPPKGTDPFGYTAYAPESNKDVELGLKSDAFDKHLRTNVALFWSKQTGTQNIVNAVFQGRSTQYTANAGDSKKYGAELEVTAIPWENMELQLSGAYLHAAYVPGTYFEQQVVFDPLNPVSVDRSGEPVPLAPKYTFGLGATQSLPVSYGRYSFHADYAYKDKVVYSYATPAPGRPDTAAWLYANELRTQKSYGLVNARVALTLNHPNLEIALWGRNLANKEYNLYHFSFYTLLGVSMDYPADPRTFGMTFNYRF